MVTQQQKNSLQFSLFTKHFGLNGSIMALRPNIYVFVVQRKKCRHFCLWSLYQVINSYTLNRPVIFINKNNNNILLLLFLISNWVFQLLKCCFSKYPNYGQLLKSLRHPTGYHIMGVCFIITGFCFCFFFLNIDNNLNFRKIIHQSGKCYFV